MGWFDGKFKRKKKKNDLELVNRKARRRKRKYIIE